ncbi:hypothetical protein [Galactobacter sp.]|uniref:hypothetical protein n=1 Tax=Galactobacter sp. TaxID=2676125 RepID=UPI0025B9DA3B|nr:hypothetical protein [Galactobacter sp.]
MGGEPKHWKRTGDYPAVGTGATLSNDHKLSVVTSWENDDEVVCGAHENNVTCVFDAHGFTVGLDTYETW